MPILSAKTCNFKMMKEFSCENSKQRAILGTKMILAMYILDIRAILIGNSLRKKTKFNKAAVRYPLAQKEVKDE